MATIRAGSRIEVQCVSGTRVLRALQDVALLDGCRIPVIGDVAAIDARERTVELSTDRGVLTVQAVLDVRGPGAQLRPVGPWRAAPVQRRGDVRSAVTLPLRGVLLPEGPLAGPPARLGLDGSRVADVEGATLDASGGGLAARLRRPVTLKPGTRLYVEVDLPDGVCLPAVAVVVAQRGSMLRARFHDITLGDRERLVRVVFARHRLELAQRSQSRD